MPLRLELRHYEGVAAIIEHGTVTSAAAALTISQSALSHRLADAEQRLGVPLFDRGPGRGLRPTAAGMVVHQAAALALAELQRCEDDILRSDGRYAATVRIAVDIYERYDWFGAFVHELRAAHPILDVQLVVLGDTRAKSLETRDVDIVIAPGPPNGALDAVRLFEDELVLIVSPSHHLASRASVEPHELADDPYLTYSRMVTPGFEYERFLSTSTVRPRLITEIEHVSAITEMVAAGSGFSVLSRWAIGSMIDAGRIAAVRCGADGLRLDWHALMRHGEAADAPARHVAERLAAHLSLHASPTC